MVGECGKRRYRRPAVLLWIKHSTRDFLFPPQPFPNSFLLYRVTLKDAQICILTNGRTPQYGTIEPIMSYTQNWATSQCTNLCKRCAASSLLIFLLSNTYLIPSKELYFFLLTYFALRPLFTRHHGLQTVLKPNNEA
jgi:hypothetical protein